MMTDHSITDPLSDSKRRKIIDTILDKNKDIPGATMVTLNEIQTEIGFINEPMQKYIASKLQVPMSVIHGVVTFYSFFTTQPRGRHTLKFCMGTACYVSGAPQLIDKGRQVLGTDINHTTPDGAITLEICRCVGACSQAPVIMIDDDIYGRMQPNKLPKVVKSYQDS